MCNIEKTKTNIQIHTSFFIRLDSEKWLATIYINLLTKLIKEKNSNIIFTIKTHGGIESNIANKTRTTTTALYLTTQLDSG